MKSLSASHEVPISRLIWLLEGLSQAYPEVKDYRRMAGIAKGVKKLMMSGEFGLAYLACDQLVEYAAAIGTSTSPAIMRRLTPVRESIHRTTRGSA